MALRSNTDVKLYYIYYLYCYTHVILLLVVVLDNQDISGLNTTDKLIISMLMTDLQLPGGATYDSQREMHTSTLNMDISLAREFQKRLSDPTPAYGLMDHVKYRKRSSKLNWTDLEYRVMYSKDVPHTSVKNPCAKNRFPVFPFCVPYLKPHLVRELIKHHRLRLDPKLGHVKCVILRIPCVCIALTNMLDKPWSYSVVPTK